MMRILLPLALLFVFSGSVFGQIPCDGCIQPIACVTDEVAYYQLIATDPFCQETSWDAICQSQYEELSCSCSISACAATCATAYPIECGNSYEGNLGYYSYGAYFGSTYYDSIAQYGPACMSFINTGPQVWFTFEVEQPSIINIYLDSFSIFSGYVLKGDCDSLTCVGAANQSGVYDQYNNFYTTAGTHYLRVSDEDNYLGTYTYFSFTISCAPVPDCPNPALNLSPPPWWVVNQDAYYSTIAPAYSCTAGTWSDTCTSIYLSHLGLSIPESDWDTPNVTPDCATDPCGIDAALMGNLDCLYNWTPECQTLYNSVSTSCNCIFDLNGDGLVNYADLLVLLGSINSCTGVCPADFNQDGAVNFADFILFNSAFGSVCGG